MTFSHMEDDKPKRPFVVSEVSFHDKMTNLVPGGIGLIGGLSKFSSTPLFLGLMAMSIFDILLHLG